MYDDPELTATLADNFRAAIHRWQKSDPEEIALYAFVELIPRPWILAGSLDAMPQQLHDELPEGTIAAFCALIPETGEEAFEVYEMLRRKRS